MSSFRQLSIHVCVKLKVQSAGAAAKGAKNVTCLKTHWQNLMLKWLKMWGGGHGNVIQILIKFYESFVIVEKENVSKVQTCLMGI